MASTPSPNTYYQDLLEDRPSYIDDPESGNENEGDRNGLVIEQDSESSELEIPPNQQVLELGVGQKDFS